MDLAALHIFRTVVRENGVTRAAAKLNRVQSNVTTRIKQLEEQLGAELFTRDGRRLVLTPAGETLLPYAERLLALADEARHAIAENRPRGRLRLGTMESTAASRLPRALAQYHQNWPEVTLELVTGVTRDLIESVRNFEVDAALVAKAPGAQTTPSDTFDYVPVFHEELVMLTPRGHRPIASARDIALSTLVAFERGCEYRAYAERWYERDGVRPARVLELGSYHAIIACVAAGAGVAVAPRAVLSSTPSEGVAVHALPSIGIIDTLLVWRRGHFSAALNVLREMLLADAAALDATEETQPSRALI
ncbi:LysR substrate-binding domain-containing protein [Caballeronia humi]|uniref:LysR family transcriptional regulator n=1 Tax=Caballeronia humi TaxID=326474 RepID=A0A158GTC7_9BURK|nr:LysR substrate-binding domain-containing protein [Caballeronia humi]SAL35414.1 LysR family transcriptional regulator [Caballeronia humi]